LSCFTVGWLADYPDPDDWAVPFMASYGAFAGRQSISYGNGLASLNAAYTSAVPHLTWGGSGLPYTGSTGYHVTGLNNSYVNGLIGNATSGTAPQRSAMYNELMDIYYAEAGSMPTDQGIGRHYERDWIHGWVGGYSNNPVAVGAYFYQMWKALPTPTTPVYGVGLDATHTIANTSFVPFQMTLDHWLKINYSVSAAYTNTSVTPLIIYVAYGIYRINFWTGEVTFVNVQTFTITRGSSLTQTIPWTDSIDAPPDGLYLIGFRAVPIGAAASVIYPTNENLLSTNTTGRFVQIGYPSYPPALLHPTIPPAPAGNWTSYPYKIGDLGSKVSGQNRFFIYDGRIDNTVDAALMLLCLKGVGPNGGNTGLHWTPP